MSVILTVKTAERAGGEIVEITRLFTGADGSMLQEVGKMRIDLIKAWGADEGVEYSVRDEGSQK